MTDSCQRSAGVLGTMNWPPQSPVLNITECLWNYLDCEKQKMQPTTETKLLDVLFNKI